jgi:outer membrane lipoprotein SlyB
MEMGMSLGMCAGAAFGGVLGQSFFGNMTIGMSIGIPIGMCAGMAIGSMKDKAVNEQLQTHAYTIKDIRYQKDTKEYWITIANKDGAERIVNTSSGEMETEGFCIGDVVFLDEDGRIEQAFDKGD